MKLEFQWQSGFDSLELRKREVQAKQRMYNQINRHDLNLFDDFRPFGYVFFSNQISNQLSINLFGLEMIAFLKHNYWVIRPVDDQDKEKWRKRFALMKESHAVLFELTICPWPKILKAVEHIGFSQLSHLKLYSCGIENIEALSMLDAPNLKILNLIYNRIYNFKSLKKANFKLQRLFLYAVDRDEQTNIIRPFCNLQHSERMDFRLISLRLEKYGYNQKIMNDVSFVSKLKRDYKTPLSLNLSIENRIIQRKVCQRLHKQGVNAFTLRPRDQRLLAREANDNQEEGLLVI